MSETVFSVGFGLALLELTNTRINFCSRLVNEDDRALTCVMSFINLPDGRVLSTDGLVDPEYIKNRYSDCFLFTSESKEAILDTFQLDLTDLELTRMVNNNKLAILDIYLNTLEKNFK